MKSTIDLLDTIFILHSDEEDEYIQSLVQYIKSRINSIQMDVEVDDPMKTAILTLILISHELRSITEELQTTNNYAINSVKKMNSILENHITGSIAAAPDATHNTGELANT